MTLQGLDRQVFRAIYDAFSPTVLQHVAEAVTHLTTKGGVVVLAALVLVVFEGPRRRAAAAIGAGLVLHLLVLEGFLKHAVARPRPIAALEGVTLRDRFLDPESYSFPSGHTTAAFMGAWVLGALWPRLRIPFLVVAALVGLSRVAVGAHYPGDVLAGAAIGVGFGLVANRIVGVTPEGDEDADEPGDGDADPGEEG